MTGITLKVFYIYQETLQIFVVLNKKITYSGFCVLFLAGISWSTVESPSSDNGIMHVSVGVDVVWCITKDRKVRA